MSDAALRSRIDMVRFLLICGLVFLHYGYLPGVDVSPFRGPLPGPYATATFVNSYILFFFLSAVPLLSFLSGWLFFNRATHTLKFYLDKYRRRARSILLPMVLWNAFILALFLAVAFADPESWLLGIVQYDVTELTGPAVVNALFGITRHPIDFQFWFLRDLLLTILVSPVLGLMLRRAPYIGLAALAFVWLGGYTLGIFFRTDVLFFFYLGGLARVARWPIDRSATPLGLVLFGLYAVLVGLRTLAPLVIDEFGAYAIPLDIATRAMRLVGAAAVWFVAPLVLFTGFGRLAALLGPLAFFLHAMHWPMNQFVKLTLAAVAPTDTNALLLLNFLVTTLITILATIGCAWLLEAVVPRFFRILSGGRSGIFGRLPMRGDRQARAAS